MEGTKEKRHQTVSPTKTHEHLGERVVVAAHPQTIEKRSALHGVTQEQRPHDGMRLIDDAFGQRMVIIANGSNLAVREKEILRLERITAADDSAVDRDEKFVVDAGVWGTRQPTRFSPAVEDHAFVLPGLAKTLVEIGDGGFVLERRRETVTAGGELTVELDEVALDSVSAETLEREGADAGLQPSGRTQVPATDDYVASVVVTFRA